MASFLCRNVDDADAADDDDDDAAGVEAAAIAANWIARTPKGCEPTAHDPIASNYKNWLFAGRDSDRRYRFVCKICNYGDLQPFTGAHRTPADVVAAACSIAS